MPNPIEYALTQIRHRIPDLILSAAFREANPVGLPIPTQEVIKKRVIEGRVLPECNIVGGPIKHIIIQPDYDVSTTAIQFGNAWHNPHSVKLYRIPPAARDGRDITEVIRVLPPPYVTMQAIPGTHVIGTNNMANQLANTLASHVGGQMIESPTVELVGNDLVKIYPAVNIQQWTLTIRLDYGPEFNALNLASIIPLGDLAVAATQSYIYINLALIIGFISITGGVEVSEIRAIIESYSQAEERYRELLLQFQGGATLAPQTFNALVEYMV